MSEDKNVDLIINDGDDDIIIEMLGRGFLFKKKTFFELLYEIQSHAVQN